MNSVIKWKKNPQQRPNYRLEENPDDDLLAEGTNKKMALSKSNPSIPNIKAQRLQTFTETRGFLANAPGFNKNMDFYLEEESSEIETPAPPPKEVTPVVSTPPVQSNKPGVYRVVDERTDGPKYVPSTELPDQYKNTKWQCHSCSSVNPPERSKCHLCGTQRGTQSTLVNSNVPAEGWTCTSCKVSNEAMREVCIMCGTKYKPPKPKQIQKATSTGGGSEKKKIGGPAPPGMVQKKRQIISKAAAPIELQYAKGSDIYNYKSGSKAVPGHGAGY